MTGGRDRPPPHLLDHHHRGPVLRQPRSDPPPATLGCGGAGGAHRRADRWHQHVQRRRRESGSRCGSACRAHHTAGGLRARGATVNGLSSRLVVEDLKIVLSGTSADVVDDVSFTVQAGEVLGLVGESGSGKTTVALALLAYQRRGLKLAGGKVLLDGQDLLTMSDDELRAVRGGKVSYVPQDPASALNPALTVGLQLRETLGAHRDQGETRNSGRVAEVLAEAHLDASPEFLRRYPHQLSGGQQQRVAIAMAFACRPQLIVLDEPTTGLDVTTQRHVLDTIKTPCRSYGV